MSSSSLERLEKRLAKVKTLLRLQRKINKLENESSDDSSSDDSSSDSSYHRCCCCCCCCKYNSRYSQAYA